MDLACLLSLGLYCTATPAGPAIDLAGAVALTEASTVAVSTAPPAATKRPSASFYLGKVQAYYDKTADLRAAFEQVYTHPVYGTKTTQKGELKVKKPGRMVWDYEGNSNPDFYADGSTMSVVEHDTRQVLTTNVKDSDFAGAVAFLFGGKKLIDEFKVRHARGKDAKTYGVKGHVVIEMMPRKKSVHYKRLFLVVDEKSGQVDAFAVRNGDDSINHFTLSGVRANTGMTDSDLTLVVPSGFVVTKG